MASSPSLFQYDPNRKVSEAAASGDWTDVNQLIEQGQLQDSQKAELIAEVCQHADTGQATQRLLAVGGGHVTDQALTQLVSRGLWTAVLRLLRAAGDDRPTWTVAGVRVDKELLHAVAEARWSDLTPFLKDRTLSSLGQQRWAVQVVCTRATQRDIILYILPSCADSLLDCVLEQLVSRGLWWAVGTLLTLQPPVSFAARQRAIQQGVQEATTWEISDFLLPHLDDDLWPLVIPHLLQRQLWWTMAKLLHISVQVFSHHFLPRCKTAHLDYLMTHLVSQNQWEGVKKLLYVAGEKQYWAVGHTNVGSTLLYLVAKRDWYRVSSMLDDAAYFQQMTGMYCDLSQRTANRARMGMTQTPDPSQHAWALQQLCQRADEMQIMAAALPVCMGSEVADILRQLVKRDFINAAARLLCEFVVETLVNWAGENEMEAHFWDLVYCHYELKDVCQLNTHVQTHKGFCTSMKLQPKFCSSPFDIFSSLQSFANRLCSILYESVLTVLSSILFLKQSALYRSHAAYAQAKSEASKIFRETLSAAYKHSLNKSVIRLDSLSPYIRLDSVTGYETEFSPMPLESVRSPLFTLHFVKAIIQGCYSQKQWLPCIDSVLAIVTCVPLAPVIQSAALTLMLREKKWDVISMADLSHVEEQVRRRLLTAAVKQKQWSVVKRWLRFTVYNDQQNWILRKAEKADQTDIVLLLTEQERPRVTSDTDCQERSLEEMMKHQLWAECRQLIEVTVNMQQSQEEEPQSTEQTDQAERVQQCVSALPQLMEGNQWLLVAKVLELPVDDAVRRQVMSQAMERGEGSVVSQCLRTMQQQLSDTERDAIFQQAVVTHVLQAVKPLVEEKDVTGLRHRDTALLEGIEQCQWDVVDHCLMHGADINMHDNEGKTLMQKLDSGKWEAVEELTKRGCELLPSERFDQSVLHRAILVSQWKTAKVLIKHGGDIHDGACDAGELFTEVGMSITPLQMLCENQQWEMIEFAATWSPRIREANLKGETILHTVCLYSCTSALHTLLERGVNPAAVTTHGHSALSYAVMGTQPQKTLSECIKLGLSTHQPCLTDLVHTHTDCQHGADGVFADVYVCGGVEDLENVDRHTMSLPTLLSVMRGLLVVTQMLYESGACVHRDLFTMQAQLNHMADPNAQDQHYKQLCNFQREREWIGCCYGYGFDGEEEIHSSSRVKLINKCARYVLDVSSSPRSLKSTCRLVISRCLKPGPSRVTDIHQLPVYDSLKQYLMFDDLVNLPPDQDETDNSGDESEEYETADDDDAWIEYTDPAYRYYADSDEEEEAHDFGQFSAWW